MAEELQKHQLLVKLLGMTTSSNDGEALVAIRKANELLTNAGWDWTRLMAGKITVVGDPFADLGDPGFSRAKVKSESPAWAQAPGHYSTPPTPSPKRTTHPISQLVNKYEGGCYCCGKTVAIGVGFTFKPFQFHSQAQDAFRVICTTCNTVAIIGPSPAPRTGPKSRKTTADDLA